MGSTLALSDSTGTVQTQYTYEPFGKTTTSGASNGNPSQYTGRENDGAGLYYYRARYYSPSLQRFISEDPIGLVGGVNLYAYVGNNPINITDPFGLKPDDGSGGADDLVDALRNLVGAAWNNLQNFIFAATVATNSDAAVDIDTLQPGPYAGESIPARDSGREFTPGERAEINRIGRETGCHTCGTRDPGTKTGDFIPDHQPSMPSIPRASVFIPSALVVVDVRADRSDKR